MNTAENNRKLLSSPGMIAALLFLMCYLTSVLTPPLQSPDEINHIKRAYLLGTGKIILDTLPGKSSGGMIDTGLLSYMASYKHIPFHPDEKVSSTDTYESNVIRWSDQSDYSEAAGTGYYFPAIYLPQAAGLKIGHILDLSVVHSYNLSRLLTLLTTCLILFAAFSIYQPSMLTLCLLIMPMTLFQMASASIDGISTALAILLISTFLETSKKKENSSNLIFACMIISTAILTSSRVHLLPLLVLPIGSYFFTKQKRYLISGLVVSILVVTWVLVAIKSTTDGRPEASASPASAAMFYAQNPSKFVSTIFNTITNKDMIIFYAESFIGKLGWLDAHFKPSFYFCFCAALISAFIASFSIRDIKSEFTERTVLLVCSIGATLLIFVALMISWKPEEIGIIQGVQGRYFLIPALLLSYVISGTPRLNITKALSAFAVFALAIFSVGGTCSLILDRYYIQSERQHNAQYKLQPTSKLSLDQPLNIDILKARGEIKGMSVLLATHMIKNHGTAKLKLQGQDGVVFEKAFDLESVGDNEYKHFAIDGGTYDSATIESIEGGGISMWQAVDASGMAVPCVIYEMVNGTAQLTKGCPRP